MNQKLRFRMKEAKWHMPEIRQIQNDCVLAQSIPSLGKKHLGL
jgi:hypothetical protein